MTDDAHELARLLPDPARDGLPEHRHHTLRERFMQEINQPVRLRPRSAALVAGIAAALVLVVAVSVVIGSVLNGGAPAEEHPLGPPPHPGGDLPRCPLGCPDRLSPNCRGAMHVTLTWTPIDREGRAPSRTPARIAPSSSHPCC